MVKQVNHIVAFWIFCLTCIGVACTQKTVPVITSRTTGSVLQQKPEPAVAPDLAAGKTIFMNRCGKCHDLPQPAQFTAQRWEGILSYMIPRARLNAEQGVHVSAYLKTNAAK